MSKFIILNTAAGEWLYTKSITVNEDGNLVTEDGNVVRIDSVAGMSTGIDPRPMEIRPEVRAANGLPPLE